MAALNLSDLNTSVAYPLENSQSSGKCLIHMKLTDFCVRSIDGLVNSNKGAVFSLRFSDNGGTMVIPVDDGEPRKFQFKTAGIRSRTDGQNILECVHQETNDYHQLSCKGPMQHRLTVQGTDQIYESTKTKVKQVEMKRKEAMTQEIKLPTKGSSRSKKPKATLIAPVTERSSPSPTFRKPVKPVTLKSSTKPSPSGGRTTPQAKLSTPQRVSHSMRERVIHFLALKPQRRDEVIVRMKKETKKSESSMAGMIDAILSEVSEVSSGNHKLKSEFHSELQVEEWPHYSDTERQLMRRRFPPPSVTTIPTPPTTNTTKRARSDPPANNDTKRRKVDHPLSSTHKPHPPLIVKDNSLNFEPSISPPPAPQPIVQEPSSQIIPSPADPPKKKTKEKKKKKDKKVHKDRMNAEPEVNSDPSSTTADFPDFKSQFPPILTDLQRADYKQMFNHDYPEYLQLKETIDVVSKDCTVLSDRLHVLPKHSEEAAGIRKLIRAKYKELQQNKGFGEGKRRCQELHEKLEHIKKQVVDYDKTR